MTTEISTHRASTGLALATFDDAFRFAKMVAASEFAPKDFRGKPESCLLAIQHGSEVGLSPMQSLQSIAVINGRPTIWGDAALALVQSSPVCEYVREYVEGEGDNLTAVCECKRKGYPAPTVSRFSMADAKRAGLAGKSGPWSQYPARMLALRARGFALRNAFADALRGLITAEEAQDYPTATQTPEPLTKSVKEVAPGITVAHVKSFEPPQETPSGKAKLAISKAKTLDDLDRIRRLIEQRAQDGTFDAAVHDELVALTTHRAEMLIGDDGQEFTHEAAEHEVTA
jgi:hypothetical protein